MKTYTVYMPEHAADGNTSIGARGPLAEFVKDGFSWPALFFGPLWLVWHRLWWELLGYVVLVAILAFAFSWMDVDPALQVATQLVLAFGLAVIGNDLRRAALERQEYREMSSVRGDRLEDCEARFFVGLQPAATPAVVSSPAVAQMAGSGAKS